MLSSRPTRINPNYVTDSSLAILNEFTAYLIEQISKNPRNLKTFQDALKVVDCLRYIKVNNAFIRYAFLHPNDYTIYKYSSDKAKGVLRDFDETSFHLNGYSNVDKCLADLNNCVMQFEQAFKVVKARGKLLEFIGKLHYNPLTGCLAERTGNALEYAKKVETTNLEQLDELIKKAFEAVAEKDTNQEVFRKIFSALSPKIGKVCIEGKSDEIILTRDVIISYLNNIMGYETPPSTISHSRTAEAALTLIKDEKAAIKIASSPISGGESWNYLVAQLLDPSHNRPVKGLQGRDRSWVWDTKTNIWTKRDIKGARGRPKPGYNFTKKESISLLPTSGRMHYFRVTKGKPVGILFNIDSCNLKNEKYIWIDNASTNSRWWVGGLHHTHPPVPTISLEELRQYLRNCVQYNIVPSHNEILAGLCKEALAAVFAPKDTLSARLNAFDIQASLGIDLPVLIIAPQGSPRAYSEKELEKDIKECEPEYKISYIFNRKERETLKTIKSTLRLDSQKLLKRYKIENLGNFALHHAVSTGDLQLITELCNKGADISLLNPYFQSPLDLALTQKDNDELIETLLQHAQFSPSSDSIGFVLNFLVRNNKPGAASNFIKRFSREFATNPRFLSITNEIYEFALSDERLDKIATELRALGAFVPKKTTKFNQLVDASLINLKKQQGENERQQAQELAHARLRAVLFDILKNVSAVDAILAYPLFKNEITDLEEAIETHLWRRPDVRKKFLIAQAKILIVLKSTSDPDQKTQLRIALENTTKVIKGEMKAEDYLDYVQKKMWENKPSILWKIAGVAMMVAGIALGVLCGLTAVGTLGLGTGAAIGFGLSSAMLFGAGIGFFVKSSPSMAAKEAMNEAGKSLKL